MRGALVLQSSLPTSQLWSTYYICIRSPAIISNIKEEHQFWTLMWWFCIEVSSPGPATATVFRSVFRRLWEKSN